ncbi:hypothetical protein OF83DRAFT_1126332 [Amylostereum chailletii]|nr:hypothetical protein OF83DRAFT_1126332 [Amylostereum chailletii]
MEEKPYTIRMGTAWQIIDHTQSADISSATGSDHCISVEEPDQGITLNPGSNPKPLRIQVVNGHLKQLVSEASEASPGPRTPTTNNQQTSSQTGGSESVHSPRWVSDSEPDRLARMALEGWDSEGSDSISGNGDADANPFAAPLPPPPQHPFYKLIPASQSKTGHLPPSNPASPHLLHDQEYGSDESTSSDTDNDQPLPRPRAGTSTKRQCSPLTRAVKRQRAQSLPSLSTGRFPDQLPPSRQHLSAAVLQDGVGELPFDEPGFTPLYEFLDMIANPTQTPGRE